VRAVSGGALGEGDASLAAVAAKLKMSERTLQRKLEAEGASFDAPLDDFRRDLALRYLADPKVAVAEVAYLLGHSEASPFHRAFERWTGKPPAEARKSAA
jgi:AraC-like DNA-binding protein